MVSVRRIINHTTLDAFTKEVIEYARKYPDAEIESEARIVEEKGCVWFIVVLLYEREENENE